MAVVEFKLTTNQLSTDIDLGLAVTSVSDPNRVIITSPSGYLVASDVTYNQLLSLLSITQSAVNPTLSNIPLNTTRQWKNTTSGELRQWSNDNGVLKSVLLS